MRTLAVALACLLPACGGGATMPALDAPPGAIEDARPGATVGARVTSSLWLLVSGNPIYTAGNAVWHGRGANLHDTRSCNACTYNRGRFTPAARRTSSSTTPASTAAAAWA